MNAQEPTRTREQGTEVTNTACNHTVKLDALRKIVTNCQYAKIDGVTVDLFSASAMVKVHDALNETNRAKFLGLPISQMARMAFQLIK